MSDAIWRRCSAFALIVAALLGGCGDREYPRDAPAPSPDPASGPTFVGSASCETCHRDEFDGWRGSHHAKAMQHASPATVLGRFDGRSVRYYDEIAEFVRQGDEYVVRTLDADGEMMDFPVRYTFGVEPIQQYLVEFPGGRLQALPWLWDTRPASVGGETWRHLYPDEYIRPGDSLHWTGRRQNWNSMCAECHSTNVKAGYDARTDTFDTTYDEVNVGCEACHGPGSEHIRQAQYGMLDSRKGLEVNLDDRGRARWVMNAETGIAERSESLLKPPQQPEACGQCHARRGSLDEPYSHGKSLADTHQVALLDDGLYFADGQIHEEVYVYGSFVQSRMYRAGVTCSDCHDPHTATLVTGPEPNTVCAQCHSPAVFADDSHLGHAPASAGCVDCHMTDRTYMVVDDRRDHSFRIPRPDIAAETGSPSACQDCHAGQTHEAAADFIAGFRDGPPRDLFAKALASARSGYANAALVSVIRDAAQPGIARATAVAALRSPFGEDDRRAISLALVDPDPLIRIGGLRALRGFAPGEKQAFATDLLDDAVLSVRIEAAVTFANAVDVLDAAGRVAFDAAATEFRRSRLLTASQSDSVLSLADFEALLGNTDQAIAAYERALYVEPGYAVARTNFADYLRIAGDDERGESVLREGLLLDDSAAILHHALGLLLVRTGRPDEALDELERAAVLDPGNTRFGYVLGVALHSLGQSDTAIETLADIYAKSPSDLDVGWAYATILRDVGRIDDARAVAAGLRERFPENRNLLELEQSLR